MSVKRIVANLFHPNPEATKKFYQQLFDLEVVMDQGWIVTFASSQTSQPQLSIASQGGSGTELPNISLEVDNLEEVYERAKRIGADICYDLVEEEWGVKRFFVRDPNGNVINVLSHT